MSVHTIDPTSLGIIRELLEDHLSRIESEIRYCEGEIADPCVKDERIAKELARKAALSKRLKVVEHAYWQLFGRTEVPK